MERHLCDKYKIHRILFILQVGFIWKHYYVKFRFLVKKILYMVYLTSYFKIGLNAFLVTLVWAF